MAFSYEHIFWNLPFNTLFNSYLYDRCNELLKKLLEAKLDFVIVGGFAGVVHGATQVTQDLEADAGLALGVAQRQAPPFTRLAQASSQ